MPYNVKLVIPPFVRNKQQFTELDCRRTKRIASSRIHVERAIGRLKEFHIFSHEICLKYFDILDNMLIVCAVFVNLQPPLLK